MTATADPRSQMLSEMAQCAYRIGMAFGAEAERAADIKTKIAFAQLFERCFFAVRVSTALELRLRQEQRREARGPDRKRLVERPDAPETEALETERLETERLEREDRELEYTERDRDRETERASFPILIRALEGVAADAANLPGPAPAALVTLRELLAHARSQPASARPSGALRSRLAASGATSAPERRPASNVAEVLARRRATDPP